MEQFDYEAYERKLIEDAEKENPDLEDRYCWKCGKIMPRNSMAWHEGWHFDSCE